MKHKIIIPALMLMIGLAFMACKETNDVKKWECVVSDRCTIKLDMYESENKFYTTVSDTTRQFILFADNVWEYYQLDGNIMVITKMEGNTNEISEANQLNRRWLIKKPSDNIMIMEYAGYLPTIGGLKRVYEFNLK